MSGWNGETGETVGYVYRARVVRAPKAADEEDEPEAAASLAALLCMRSGGGLL